jgi:organic radical activating enzyme
MSAARRPARPRKTAAGGRLESMFGLRVVVVDATTRCNQSCVFCYERHLHFTRPDMSLSTIKRIISDAGKDGFDSIVFIGGEITMVDWLLPVIKLINEAGLRPGIVTNGLNLASRAYVRELMLAGLGNLEITYLSDVAADDLRTSHAKDGLARRRRAFENVAALRHLGWNNFHLAVNTVITTINYRYLPRMVKSVLAYKPDLVTLKMLGITHDQALKDKALIPRMAALKKPVADAMRALELAGVPFTFDDMPLCMLAPKYRAYRRRGPWSRQYLLEHWDVSGKRVVVATRAVPEKLNAVLEPCRDCALYADCPKPQGLYVKLFGSDEFKTIAASRRGKTGEA